jgi:hypothetical protein
MIPLDQHAYISQNVSFCYFSDPLLNVVLTWLIRKLLAYQKGAWHDNYIRRAREITDELYPWGMTLKDYRDQQRSE